MITLRTATVSDGEALAKIYKYYVENTAITFEYVAPDAEEFSLRIAHKTEKYPFIVAEEDGHPVGYAYASEYRERAAYAWDVELSVYVDIAHQGKGIGPRLYSALEKLLAIQNVANTYACITDPNPHSVTMHEAMGFKYVGRFNRAGFKMGQWLDVLWFEKRLKPTDIPLPIIPFSLLDKDQIDQILTQMSDKR